MDLPPFLLDHWLAKHSFATPPIAYDLASSTGPKWTVGELLALGDGTGLDDTVLSYAPSEGGRALREAIGTFLGVDPDWVVVTLGASEAFSILLCAAARPGTNVVLPSPGYPAFDPMAGVWGLGVRHVRLSRDNGFRQHAADVLDAVDESTVFALVNTPHNPAGTIMPRDGIEELAAALHRKGVPLVVDEVYHPLYFGKPQPSAASLSNVIAMGDMSKAMSLAGLRIGWLVERDPQRREKMIDARSYFTISSSPLLERLAVHALANRDVLLTRLQAVAGENLVALSDFMDRVSDVLAWARPAGGTVCFPWFRDGRDSRPFCEALAANGVLVAPGDCFGMPEHMRLGFALLRPEKFSQALGIFERILREG
ncbi:pyridoxal phosphate-dependent aminotransferase [Mesorhizobium sp. KR9-304]|uniref:pyridoxal phosphate-dependent aminotransferase n=1 Tax=Mesorhizobium sp. KR9-304 TaxID=3156614 RepID=UPI0032B4D576